MLKKLIQMGGVFFITLILFFTPVNAYADFGTSDRNKLDIILLLT